jgi:hypothetical protein
MNPMPSRSSSAIRLACAASRAGGSRQTRASGATVRRSPPAPWDAQSVSAAQSFDAVSSAFSISLGTPYTESASTL